MGSSLFGKLKGMLSSQKTSDISRTAPSTSTISDLSRIGLATKSTASPMENSSVDSTPAVNMSAPDVVLSQQTNTSFNTSPVGVQFFAEVPHQQCAEEIVNVSKRANNCLSAVAQPIGGDLWSVSITLNMTPVPQDIHTVESTLQAWTEKLGGSSKGWGLSQNQAA